MANENAVQGEQDILHDNLSNDFDFAGLEAKFAELEGQLDDCLADLADLQEESEKIGSPDTLGNAIKNVVWDQFINQIAEKAGEDFIKESYGNYLDLSNEAHILTAENFEVGEMPTHNPNKDKYQQRYDEYRSDFQTDRNAEVKMGENMRYNDSTKTYERYDKKTDSWVEKTRYNEKTKVWEDWDSKSENWKKKLAPDARKKFDTRTDDQKGTAAVAKDHTISVAEQLRDTEAAAYVDRDTRKEFAKSDSNLNDLDARANSSKKDSTMDEWLNSEKDGKKPAERFDIDEDALRKKDAEAREKYKDMKEEGKKRTIEEGKKSQKEEAFRIGGKALRAVAMQLLADLMKEIIGKLIKWLKSARRNLQTFLDSVKEAIRSFVGKLKTHLFNAGNTVFSTVVTAIGNQVLETIKRVWMFLKQGWRTLKEAVDYIRNPENKGKPVGILILEVGKIIVAGVSAAGAIALSEVIEKAITNIPVAGAFFAAEIPLIGSLANILGIFFGGVVAGIAGVIAIHLLQKQIEKAKKTALTEETIKKGNEVLNLQRQVQEVSEAQLIHTKYESAVTMKERHDDANKSIQDALDEIKTNYQKDNSFDKNHADIHELLRKLRGLQS